MISKRTSRRQKVDTKAATVISTDDTGNFRSAIVEALGKAQKVQAITPYGLCNNPPDNSLAIALNINGIAANTVAMIDDPKNRKKNLAKGEVVLYNYLTESYIYLKEDGTIEISGEQSSISVNPDGTIEVTGTTTINGSTTINGDLTVTGKITCDDLTTSTITSLNAHMHQAGGYNIGGTPVTGVGGTSP